MEWACVSLSAISSIMVRTGTQISYPSNGKSQQIDVRGKVWNRAKKVTKEGEERKERISIPYTKYPDVNKKILNGYLTGSHRMKAWKKKRSIHCAAFFFVAQLYLLYQTFIFPKLTQGIFIIKIEVGFVTICWDCRFPIKAGDIPSVCTGFYLATECKLTDPLE